MKYVEAANNSGLLKSSGIDFSTYDIRNNIDTSAFSAAINALVEAYPDNAFYAEILAQFKEAN